MEDLTGHLERAGEADSPLRFLRLLSWHAIYDGILREDELYKWIVSPERKAPALRTGALCLGRGAGEGARRYADLVRATELMNDGGDYPSVTRIGFMNKVKSRQHLVLLLALTTPAPPKLSITSHNKSHFSTATPWASRRKTTSGSLCNGPCGCVV